MGDWRDDLLSGVSLRAPATEAWNPLGWPGYDGAGSVSWGVGGLAGSEAVAVSWDFAVHGGSFGERDASAFCDAVDAALDQALPLVTLVRSGGTRLQEGVLALAGMARSTIALRRLGEAGLPHLSVADAPTTGGVWVTIASRADLRAAVAGAAVGFGGPRVVEAVTGSPAPPDSHTADSAYAHGLVDALLAPSEVEDWLATALLALGRSGHPSHSPVQTGVAFLPETAKPSTSGRAQVTRAREDKRSSGGQTLDRLLAHRVELRAPRADPTVRAAVGRLADGGLGPSVVMVALAAHRAQRPTPDGYRLLTRAARFADRLDLPLLTLIDVSGAEPGPAAEADGLAAAIGDAMDAVLACRSPTLSVVHGEGGSGGALAGAVTDRVLITPDAYVAALGPEGAAAALRLPAEQIMDLMRIRPADLIEVGFADGVALGTDDLRFAAQLGEELGRLHTSNGQPGSVRLERRLGRWGGPVRPRGGGSSDPRPHEKRQYGSF